MKKLAVSCWLLAVSGAMAAGAAETAESVLPQVWFAFDTPEVSGWQTNEGTFGSAVAFNGSYSYKEANGGAAYVETAGGYGVHSYSPWCNAISLGKEFTVALRLQATTAANRILFCLGALQGNNEVLMLTTKDAQNLQLVVVKDTEVLREEVIPVDDVTKLNAYVLSSNDGTVTVNANGAAEACCSINYTHTSGAFQLLGGYNKQDTMPAYFHGCGTVDNATWRVADPDTANVIDDFCVWTGRRITADEIRQYANGRVPGTIPVSYVGSDGTVGSRYIGVNRFLTDTTTTFDNGGWYAVTGTVTCGSIKVNGSAHLILCDGASLTVDNVDNVGNKAAIDVSADGKMTSSLAIYGQQNGSGSLAATGGEYGAGIGGGYDCAGGIITVNGGTVTAKGGYGGAGIGGGMWGAGGSVTVNGGTVTATGGERGAGIGGGYDSAGGSVTMNGGTVTAKGDYSAAGIGGGMWGAGGSVTVNGGTVTATGGERGAGIGGGYERAGGSVTVNGGMVTATGGERGAGIGGGKDGADGSVDLGEKVVVVEGAVGNGSSYAKILNTDDYPSVTVGAFEHMTATWTSGDGAVTNPVNGTFFRVKSGTANVTVIFTAHENYEIPGDPVVRLDGAVMTNVAFGDGNDYAVPTVRCVFGDIAYLDWDDANGQMTNVTISAADYEPVTGATRELADGKWYVVVDHVVINDGGNIKVNGSAHLILCDNASLTVGNVANNKAAIDISANGSATSSLAIYGQQNGSGSLAATGGYGGAGIGGGYERAGGIIMVNGGTVTAKGGYGGAGIGGGMWGAGGSVTVNGGTVTATGGERGAGIGGGQDGADGSVDLGEKVAVVEGAVGNGSSYAKILNTDDYPIVTVGAFEHMTATWTSGDGTVTNPVNGTFFWVKSGTANVTVIFTAHENYEITGDSVVRLDGAVVANVAFGDGNDYAVPTVRCVFGDIAYLDWDDANGQMTNATISATDYEVVTSATRELADGKWYVVVDHVVINDGGNIKVNGSAHLILCDNASLTVGNVANNKAAIDVSVDGSTTSSLAIYGQQNGTGRLTATGCSRGAGIGGGSGGAGGVITINGGMVTATGGDRAAGIGGGQRGAGGTVVIRNGAVKVVGGRDASVIGHGCDHTDDGSVSISGGIFAMTVKDGWCATGYGVLDNPDSETRGGYPHAVLPVAKVTVCLPENVHAFWTSGDGSKTNAVEGGCFLVQVGTPGVKLRYEVDPAFTYLGGELAHDLDDVLEDTIVECRVEVVHREAEYVDADGRLRTNRTFRVVDVNTTTLTGGWYLVEGTVSREGIDVAPGRTVHLILADGASLTVQGNGYNSAGIDVLSGETLVIYGQTKGTGALVAQGGDEGAGIGGDGRDGAGGGAVTVNGGIVTATGGDEGAGIGGGRYGAGGAVTVNGGVVTAKGGFYAAGIGGGSYGAGGPVTVNGGVVTATGRECAAGIGGGNRGAGGPVTVNGGVVTATGHKYAAGIGGGERGAGGKVVIRNGAVKVFGGQDASVIGHGCDHTDDGSVSISGGIFAMTVKDGWLAENCHVVRNLDPETKADYPHQVITLFKLTVPQVEHAAVRVMTNGTAVAGFAGSVDVLLNSTVRVAFAAEPDYRIVANGEKEWNIVGDVTFGTTPGFPLPTVEGIPGTKVDPWQVGADVVAYTNANGALTITGTGAMEDFASATDVPWEPTTVTAVTVEEGVKRLGANAFAALDDAVTVNGTTMAMSRFVAPALGPASTEPSGAISPAEFDKVAIIDGKAYLGVSVYTNSEVKVRGVGEDVGVGGEEAGWGVATNGVIIVPAPGKQGFFYLLSKPAPQSDALPVFDPKIR